MSAHARFRINMFVRVRRQDDRKIVAMSVTLPNMASSMMTPSAEARKKYSVSGSCAARISELLSWVEFSLGTLRFDTTINLKSERKHDLGVFHIFTVIFSPSKMKGISFLVLRNFIGLQENCRFPSRLNPNFYRDY